MGRAHIPSFRIHASSVFGIGFLLIFQSQSFSLCKVPLFKIQSRLQESPQTSYETFGDGALSDKTFSQTYTESENEDLPKWLTQRCEECGWKYPTLVQERALDVILEGQDCVLQAQTGSGKTLAYILPVLASIDPSRAAIQAVIVVPTRELGVQVCRVARRLAASSGGNVDDLENNSNAIDSEGIPARQKIMIMSLLQGSGNKRQRAWAKSEPPHIVIGTPGELGMMVKKGGMKYNSIKFVVVDEVDACLLQNGGSTMTKKSKSAALNLSGSGPLHELLSRYLSPSYVEPCSEQDSLDALELTPTISHGTDRQTVFVSATIPQHNHFMKQCVQNQWTVREPVHVCASPGELIPPTLQHCYTVCAGNDQKMGGLKRIIRKELSRPKCPSSLRFIVFCETNRPLEEMAEVLERDMKQVVKDKELTVNVLRYEDSTSARTVAMEAFRGPEGSYLGGRILESEKFTDNFGAKSIRILLSTDLAARGLDVDGISHVINFDLPLESDTYVHRGGRAGRLGKKGIVLSLITSEQEFVLERLGNKLGLDLKCLARQKAHSKK